MNTTRRRDATVVALDCEMVGVGHFNALAQVTIVGEDNRVIYSAYVRPPDVVTDYRTAFSGITKEILAREGQSFTKVRTQVLRHLEGKIVTGHALLNDFRALRIPMEDYTVRNTAMAPFFQQVHATTGARQPRKLKSLAKEFLGKNIQVGVHDATEDARTSMELYKMMGEERYVGGAGRRWLRWQRRDNRTRKVRGRAIPK